MNKNVLCDVFEQFLVYIVYASGISSLSATYLNLSTVHTRWSPARAAFVTPDQPNWVL